MKKSITLFLFFALSAVLFAQHSRLSNGWEYSVLREGKDETASSDHAIEAFFLIRNTEGKILGSTYPLGAPSYQIVKDLSENFQIAAAVTAEGGKYLFYIPIADFKKEMGDTPISKNLPGDHVEWEMEIVRVLPAKPAISIAVGKTLQQQNAAAAIEEFRSFTQGNDEIYAGELDVNKLGYAFLSAGHIKEAIEVFEFNVKANPTSGNVYDSLAEALMADGQKQPAIEHYKKSLELNPKNENAKKMIVQLEKQ